MNDNKTNKSSVQQIQSSMFLSNLRKEMDKMADNCRRNEMIRTAHEYIKSGMTPKETEELLILDAFDPNMVKSLMASDNLKEEFASDVTPKWGFDIEDLRGRIYSSSDFGIVVTASDEQEARIRAEEEIEKFSTLQLDCVTNIYRL